jgi:ribokinase
VSEPFLKLDNCYSGEPTVLGVGVVSADHFLRVQNLPMWDGKADAHDMGWYPGGMAANFAVAARYVGVRSGLWTRFGDDDFGVRLRGALTDTGIEILPTESVPSSRSWWSVGLLDDRSEKAMIVVSGHLSLPELNAASSPLQRWGLVYPIFIEPQWCLDMSLAAKGSGCLVATDLEPQHVAKHWGSEGMDRLLEQLDIVFAKQDTCRAAGFGERLAFSRFLHDRGVSVVVVTDGRKPVYCSTPTVVLIAEPPAVEVVDSTGAGDALAGAFCAGVVAGLKLSQCLADGVMTSAQCVAHLGCQSYASHSDSTWDGIAPQVHVLDT